MENNLSSNKNYANNTLTFEDASSNKFNSDITLLHRNTLKNNPTNSNGNIVECNQIGFWVDNIRDHQRYWRINEWSNNHFRSLPASPEEKKLKKDILANKKTDIFYQFKECFKLKVGITHLQVRKNFKFYSEFNIAYYQPFSICSYNTLTKVTFELISLNEYNTNDYNQLICFDIYKMDTSNILLIGLGLGDGIVDIVKIEPGDKQDKVYKKKNIISKLSTKICDSSINDVKFLEEGSKLLISTNDGDLIIYDISKGNKLTSIQVFKDSISINDSSFNLSKSCIATVGDAQYVKIFDCKTSKLINTYYGHYDHGISIKFQPNSDNIFATANQDGFCKIWDLRKNTTVKTLSGVMDGLSNICFDNTDFLIFAEYHDYIHIYNMKLDTMQDIGFFGKTAGLDINKNTQNIFFGAVEESLYGVLEYDKIKFNKSFV